MERSGKIYKIINTINNKIYIGKTVKQIKHRFQSHCYYALKRESPTHLHRAIRKYGRDNFIFEEIETCKESILSEREIYWIAELSPDYNMTLGGEGMLGYKFTDEQKKRSSESRKGLNVGEDNHFYGRKHTTETRKAISKKLKGRPSACGFAGKKHKPESKQKTSQTLRNDPTRLRIKVKPYVMEGNFIREFSSITEAAEHVNTCPSNIKYTCEGKFKHCKKYKWSY